MNIRMNIIYLRIIINIPYNVFDQRRNIYERKNFFL